MTGWDALWERRSPPRKPGSVRADLMAADGLDSGFARLSQAAWMRGVDRLAGDLRLEAGMSVFEVGCGAGAFLYELARLGCTVAGIDRSPALVRRAAEALPTGTFAVADASALEPKPLADAVVSFGVFLYFNSHTYADRVIDRMVAKARRVVAILDLPDAATRSADLDHRYELAGGRAAYAARYSGLEHRYYDRDWVAETLRARGLLRVRVESQAIEGYGNSPFRFNAWGFKAPHDPAA